MKRALLFTVSHFALMRHEMDDMFKVRMKFVGGGGD